MRKLKIISFCGDWDKSVFLNGKAFSPFLDTLLESLNTIWVLRIARKNSKLIYHKSHKFSVPQNALEKLFCIKKAKDDKAKSLATWKLLFKYLKPDLCLTIEPLEEMCYIARKSKVKLIEVAHAYGRDLSDPLYGIKAKKNKWQHHQPEYNIVFDEKTLATQSALNDSHKSKTFLAKHYLLKKNNYPEHRETKILVTLQWGYSGEFDFLKDILPNGFLPNIVFDFIRKNPHINIQFKMHPVQVQTGKQKLFEKTLKAEFGEIKKFCVRQNSSTSIWQCLQNVDLHLTMSSASCYEAAFLGIPSVTLCPTLLPNGIYEKYFDDLEKYGYLQKCTLNLNALEEAVKKSLNSKLKPLEFVGARPVHEILNDILEG